MKIKQTIQILSIVIGICAVFTGSIAFAAECGGVNTSVVSCDASGGNDIAGSGLWAILLIAINILTAGVGVAAVAGIIYGSIMYATASGNPEQVKKAIEIIRNTVIGLVMYALMYAFLNYLIPGGIFS